MPDLSCLKTGTFIAFISDNAAYGIHRPGYNGVASLIPRATGNNIFVPTYAGLNYETINLSGMPPYVEATGRKFEPRHEPMHVASADGQSVVLVQPETSHAHVSARLTFSVQQPCHLHQRIELTPHRVFGTEGQPSHLSSLWASYIHMPRDRHIYTRPGQIDGPERTGWFGLTKADHASTETDVRALPDVDLDHDGHLAAMEKGHAVGVKDVQELEQSLGQGLEFYYGLLDHGLVFLMMFKRPESYRLAYSPCGGGQQPAWSPAWDYVLHADFTEPGHVCRWDLCLTVKPFAGRGDILEEVRRFREA